MQKEESWVVQTSAALSALGLALALTVTGCVIQSGEPRSPDEPQETPVATFEMNSLGGRPLVDVSLNGEGPFTFFMDTGAAHSVLDAGLAHRLQLPVTGSMKTGSPLGGAETETDLVSLSTVALGELTFANQEMALLDLAGMMPGGDMPLGVLSYRLFEGYRLEFDYPAQKMRLYAGGLPEPNGRDIFDFDTEIPSIPVSLAGQMVDMHLDTGSPSSFTLPLALAADLPLQAEPELVGRGRTVDADFEVLAAQLEGDVLIGALTIEGPMLHFIKGAPVGNVGSQTLGRFVVSIDPANNRVRLAASTGEAEAGDGPRRVILGGERKRYGVRFHDIGGDPIAVVGVDAGALAAVAGLAGGDLITAINGQPVGGLDRDARVSALRGSPLELTIRRGQSTQTLVMSFD